MSEAQIRGCQRKLLRKIDNLRLFHHRNSPNRFIFRTITLRDSVNLMKRHRRREHVGRISQPSRKFIGMWSIAEEFKPAGGIDDDQNRSFFSRKPLVRIPRRNPRPSDKGRSGTSVITPPLVTTWNSCPGLTLTRERTSFGITT